MATDKTVADVNTQARALLNDQAATFYTDAILLPHVKAAYSWAANEISRLTPSPKKKITVLNYTTPAADLSAVMPADHYQPEKLEWRLNTSENFVEVSRLDALPSRDGSGEQLDTVREWVYRDRIIYVNVSTRSGLLRLTYLGLVPELVNSASPILYDNLHMALAYYTASVAAGSRGQGPRMAALMGSREQRIGALGFMEQVLDIVMKNEQLVPRRGVAFSGVG